MFIIFTIWGETIYIYYMGYSKYTYIYYVLYRLKLDSIKINYNTELKYWFQLWKSLPVFMGTDFKTNVINKKESKGWFWGKMGQNGLSSF